MPDRPNPQDDAPTVNRPAPAQAEAAAMASPLFAPFAEPRAAAPIDPRTVIAEGAVEERTVVNAGLNVEQERPVRPVVSPAAAPTAREVLEALSHAGVFEPREAVGPIVWDKPNEKTRKRTAIGLSISIVLVLGGAFGLLGEIQRRRAHDHDAAEVALAKVETDLNAGNAALLPDIEKTIGRAFELDSRSPRAAVDWLEERAMKGLLQGGAEIAFEDAMGRALEVKVPEEKIAFARVAAFLFQSDTGGAAGLMPTWDVKAANEPMYQLITGATLDHAGDVHAVDRYQAAAKLAPNLVLADILVARAVAIDGDPNKAADLAKQFRVKYPDRPEGAALVALAWARDPSRGEQPPPDVAETIAHASDMPLPLRVVPHALLAIAAIDKHTAADAKPEIEKGLTAADDPGMATWLGSLALETHDEALVRKAALLAVTFSAVYPPARVLAARIALLAGRLDEALKATEDLDPTSADVAIVRAAVAFERADADAMGRALEALSPETRKLPVFTGLNLAPDVLGGARKPGPSAQGSRVQAGRDQHRRSAVERSGRHGRRARPRLDGRRRQDPRELARDGGQAAPRPSPEPPGTLREPPRSGRQVQQGGHRDRDRYAAHAHRAGDGARRAEPRRRRRSAARALPARARAGVPVAERVRAGIHGKARRSTRPHRAARRAAGADAAVVPRDGRGLARGHEGQEACGAGNQGALLGGHRRP